MTEATASRLDNGRPLPSTSHQRKLFVIHKSVFEHDPQCAVGFDDNDVFVVTSTMQQLRDDAERRTYTYSDKASNARQASRVLREIIDGHDIKGNIPLAKFSRGEATGNLYLQTRYVPAKGKKRFVPSTVDEDETFLQTVSAIAREDRFRDRQVVLVTKEIHLQVMAQQRGIAAQDYFNDMIPGDVGLPTGIRQLSPEFVEEHLGQLAFTHGGDCGICNFHGAHDFTLNEFVWWTTPNKGRLYQAIVQQVNGADAMLRTIVDYSRIPVWSIKTQNREQLALMNHAMNTNVHFLSVRGPAGTGKTLLTLAAAFEQKKQGLYDEIIVTRATVEEPEEKLGFFPGKKEEKLGEWMSLVTDNLKILEDSWAKETSTKKKGHPTVETMSRDITYESIGLTRGRSLFRTFLISEETQNLTRRQIKKLITRAGPGSKVVCVGDLEQIDTQDLDWRSSGLAHATVRMGGDWPKAATVALTDGSVRSELADRGSQRL